VSSIIKLFLFLIETIKSFLVYNLSKFRKSQKIEQQKELDKKIVGSLGPGKLPSWKQFKRLPNTLTKIESLILRSFLVLMFICLIYLFYNVYYKNLQVLPKNGGEFAEGLIGSPLYINPILAYNDVDLDLSQIIFSGLLKYNDNLELVPDLAEKYEISQDQKIYTFYLKKNIKWHDDKELTASDVVFTFQSIQNPEFKSPLHRSFQGVTVEKLDDYAIKFTLQQPYADFLNLLTTGIIPQHIWYDIPAINAKLAIYNQKPIGSGPYKFKSLIKERSGLIRAYTLEKNKNYYERLPYINKIVFKFYPDYETATSALINKEVQNLNFLPRDYLKKINKRQYNLYNFPLVQYSALFFNPKNNELLKDKKIKEALAYAIDKNKIIEDVLLSQGQIIDGPILPNFPGYNPDIKKYSYAPQTSLEILTNNGWTIEGELLKKKDQELKVTLTTVEQTENIKVANLIKEFWTSIGVNVELQIVAKEKIENDVITPRNYQILLYGEIIGYDPDLFPFWHSSQKDAPGLNLAGYVNRNTDQLLEEARQTNDLKIRGAKYTEFQNILIDDLPAIFLYSPVYTYPTSKKIKGINLQEMAMPSDRFINIENWFIKTKRKFIK